MDAVREMNRCGHHGDRVAGVQRWLLVMPFVREAGPRHWLARFIADERLVFDAVPATYDHDRSRARSGLRNWMDYLRHALAAWRTWRRQPDIQGIVTCFPQLPVMLGVISRLLGVRIPVLAWAFNIGALPGGLRQRLARFGLRDVDCFVVHSTHEITECSRWLGLPQERFRFVPLQCPHRDITAAEDRDAPFMLAMGSAQRDYRLLFEVLAQSPRRTVVVAGPHAVQGLVIPPCVELCSGLSLSECHQLLQRARISVIPVSNHATASGQVTLLDSMIYGRPTIVTRCPGSIDYVVDGEDAVLVEHGDAASLRSAIGRLWDDDAFRGRLGAAARASALARFSDEAVARQLAAICHELAAQR